MGAKKKLREYISKGVRKLKHRKGFGVHSPFAYAIITEVIEEKLPYYAYRRMQRTYDKQAAISHKVACLLLRLANRFHCRNAAELTCDGGYTLLPLILTDSRLKVITLANETTRTRAEVNLSWLPQRMEQITFAESFEQFDEPAPYDFIAVNVNPYEDPAEVCQKGFKPSGVYAQQLVEWIMAHSKDDTVIFVRGIQQGHINELFWDQLCDRDDVSITIDLYDYGLAILKPRFFKQHYVVAF
jgi:hypothetical protein